MFGDAEDDNVVVHTSSFNVQCSFFKFSVLFNDTVHFFFFFFWAEGGSVFTKH